LRFGAPSPPPSPRPIFWLLTTKRLADVDARSYSQRMSRMTATPPGPSAEQRRALLDQTAAQYASWGYRVESQSEFQVTIVKGTNHILHLILTILTLGIWAIIWIALVLFRRRRKKVITIDPFGGHVIT
jgi:hypothetical protein